MYTVTPKQYWQYDCCFRKLSAIDKINARRQKLRRRNTQTPVAQQGQRRTQRKENKSQA